MVSTATSTLSVDERRTARLLFATELAAGTVDETDLLALREVQAAVRTRPVPLLPTRIAQAFRRRAGRLDALGPTIDEVVAARRAVLGAERAYGPPRLLVRMDEYPHALTEREPSRSDDAAFGPWRDIMAAAGCAHLIAVLPRVPDDPMEASGPSRRLSDGEVARLRQLKADGVEFALHGYDHRTQRANPRRHTELGGRSTQDLADLLDRAMDELKSTIDIAPQVLVPPYNTFNAWQYPTLAERFPVVTGGPESILRMGYQPTAAWRNGAVYLPAYPPLYGTAAEVLEGLKRYVDDGTGVWTPIALHWRWEAERGWKDLDRLAAFMAPYAVPWSEFLDLVERSR